MAWNGSRFLAVGSGGTVIGSGDGLTWSAPLMIHPNSLLQVIWSGARWVAVGGDYARLVFTSEDGTTWTTLTGASASLSSSTRKLPVN